MEEHCFRICSMREKKTAVESISCCIHPFQSGGNRNVNRGRSLMLCGVIYSLIVIDTLVIIANDKDCGLGILKQADKEIGRQIEVQYYCQL